MANNVINRRYQLNHLYHACLQWYNLNSIEKLVERDDTEPFQLNAIDLVSPSSLAKIVAGFVTGKMNQSEARYKLIIAIDEKMERIYEMAKAYINEIYRCGVSDLDDKLVFSMADLDTYRNWNEDVKNFLDAFEAWNNKK